MIVLINNKNKHYSITTDQSDPDYADIPLNEQVFYIIDAYAKHLQSERKLVGNEQILSILYNRSFDDDDVTNYVSAVNSLCRNQKDKIRLVCNDTDLLFKDFENSDIEYFYI